VSHSLAGYCPIKAPLVIGDERKRVCVCVCEREREREKEKSVKRERRHCRAYIEKSVTTIKV